MDTMTNLKGETGRDARRRIRAGGHRVPTSRAAPGYVQGNLAILPSRSRRISLAFASRTPSPVLCSRRRSPATGACRRSARTSTSAPTSRSTECGRRVSWSKR